MSYTSAFNLSLSSLIFPFTDTIDHYGISLFDALG